ncbi:RNA polymerase sigma factor SigZ [Xanthovirga aplysinae]|uniref:RNA polymerase sigma factor SigZ n=1 Tax=Xanthovirga aplysinae TaxID=2529853 RepID=UPI0012BC781D|nr:RNA polymerase sigma factor SigZ [Xanthovirga aplysinae]MTI31965.1 RNA polymerase sigma factor SigZ [Xanthovirga aplysinae]
MDINKIWDDFHQELKAFILNKTRNSADTDDILQEVFIKIMQNMNKVKHAKSLRHYLFGIVRNAITDYFRNKQYDQHNLEIPEKLTEEESESLNETIAECCIKPFINQLPENYKKALLSTEFENISQKDMANKLNISYSAAKSRVQRGKEKLKGLILQCCSLESDKYGNLSAKSKKNCNCA